MVSSNSAIRVSDPKGLVFSVRRRFLSRKLCWTRAVRMGTFAGLDGGRGGADSPRLVMAKPSHRDDRSNAEQERDLDIEIGFLEGIVRRDSDYVEALRVLGDDYTRRGRFADGLQVDEQLRRLRPDDPLTHYNLACSYSLTDQPQRAVAALSRALDLGYRDFKWMRRDPDLRKARRHPLFKLIRERARALEVGA
jgi:hypothetical protein